MASIGKAKSIAHGSALAEYADKKGEELTGKNVIGHSPGGVIQEMREQQLLHTGRKISKPYFSLVFAPDPKSYGKDADLNKLTEEFMQRFCSRLKTHKGQSVDFENLQFKAWKHEEMTERKIPHAHILCNRILPNGEVIADSWIGKIAKATAEEMDRERHLKTAEDIGKDLRTTIKDKAHEALKEYAKVSRKGDFNSEAFAMYCQDHGLYMTVARASTGRVSGYYLQLDGSYDGEYHTTYKVSDIDKNLTLKRIGNTFDRYVYLAYKERKEEEEKQRKAEEQARKQAEAEEKKKQEQTKKQEDKRNEPRQDNRPRRHFHR